MRISLKQLAKVKVEVEENGYVDLINVQTGEVEEHHPTGSRVTITLNNHRVDMYVSANSNGKSKTKISSGVYLDFSKELNVPDLAALFTVHKEQMALHAHAFDHIDELNLYEQRNHRDRVRTEILKQEEKYMKKLMLDEVKRLAKENVDARKPPVTSVIPKSTVLTIGTGKE